MATAAWTSDRSQPTFDQPPRQRDGDVQHAMGRLKSFRNGDIAVQEIVCCGPAAIPALRALLFSREPSGLYQSRVRAVDALAKLGVNETLIEFLAMPRDIADPTERLGEDAVINAAARAVAQAKDQRLFDVLRRLAARPCLAGVIFALGASGRPEAVPLFVAALREDESRMTAEAALRALGGAARASLIAAAVEAGPYGEESESHLRGRRSALRLLLQMSLSRDAWNILRGLLDEDDLQIALAACELALRLGSPFEQRRATLRLLALSERADWLLREDIERCLRTHAHAVTSTMKRSAELQHAVPQPGHPRPAQSKRQS